MSPDFIFLLCFLCVVVIISVIGIQFVLLYYTRKQVTEQQAIIDTNKSQISRMSDDMEALLSKMSDGIKYKIDSNVISILDLAEFKDLHPTLKEAYAQYIKEILAPAIMAGINKTMKDNQLDDYLLKNEKQIHEAVYSIAQDIQKNGFNTLALTNQVQPKKK